MPEKKYRVTLEKEEKSILHGILSKGKRNAQKRKRSRALLLADEGYTDEMISERSGMSRRGLEQLRERFVEEGFEIPLEGKPKGRRQPSIQGEDEARLVARYAGRNPRDGSAGRRVCRKQRGRPLAVRKPTKYPGKPSGALEETNLSRVGLRSGVSRPDATGNL
ncbi:MAG: helix-turn-helix domain-containing protein [Treponema sp.]|jgi:hypothetical protein|nr:helix-turn-helix domain-containing protein [Treponema sp.]